MPDQYIRDGLSALATGQSLRAAGSFGAAISSTFAGKDINSDPRAVMEARRSSESFGRLVYPSDRPPYYFKMDMSRYKRSSWSEIGELSPEVSIILPIPSNIIDNHNVQWEGEELGLPGALAMNGINGDTFGGAGFFRNIAQRFFGGPAGSALTGLAVSQGLAINNYLTMMLKGPVYKEHTFGWRFSPNSPAESRTLMEMRRIINDGQAPALSAEFSGAFFDYPYIFSLSFHHDSTDMSYPLYEFKKCVLTSSSWDFAPNKIPAFYSETQGPEAVEVAFRFTELELWLRGDFGSGLSAGEGGSILDRIFGGGDTGQAQTGGRDPLQITVRPENLSP